MQTIFIKRIIMQPIIKISNERRNMLFPMRTFWNKYNMC